MEKGKVVEFIDRQKIMCAVVLEVKQQRLRLLTENNREVNLSMSRLSHTCNNGLDLSIGRDKLVEALRETATKRNTLINRIDIKELWEILNTEQEWIDLETMTEFCFPECPTGDHESAVVRAFFADRTYFKFNNDRFFPYTPEEVEKITTQAEEEARKNRIIETGGNWLKSILSDKAERGNSRVSEMESEFVDILRSFYIFEKESPHYAVARAILARAGLDTQNELFKTLVKLGVIDTDENVNLYRFGIPVEFSGSVLDHAADLLRSSGSIPIDPIRKDLTALPLITIDGQSTLDFDDALSIEDRGDYYFLGVHIADVGHYIAKGSIIDQEALTRGSSIYMPDQKIPMLPSCLAEDLCSLKATEVRPAISVMASLDHSAKLLNYEIFPSLIQVKSQLTYYDVNTAAEEKGEFVILQEIAQKFRQYRLSGGAVQITLPDINVWTDNSGEISINRINRESPGRMLVSELMIMANWLMAKFLAEQDAPAVYRSQPGPKERLLKDDEGTLFQNYMQRKLLSRFILSSEPEHHSGLGLDVYVTATSPIRKYFDLVTQRQIRAIFGLESFYTRDEIDNIIHMLELPMSNVAKIQYHRHRYWVLRFLEKRVGQKEEALVIYKRRNSYLVLLPEYMIECDLPISEGINLKPEDLIQVTIQHVNPRKDVLSIFMG
jgi:exoribonuclease-2